VLRLGSVPRGRRPPAAEAHGGAAGARAQGAASARLKGKRHKHTRGFSNNLLKVWAALWTFTEVAGVEPTNNRAERALRGPVIHRKLSLGSQSEQGQRTIERLLTASVTCRLQRRSLFTHPTDALTATARGHPAPSLV
jgi:transposase